MKNEKRHWKRFRVRWFLCLEQLEILNARHKNRLSWQNLWKRWYRNGSNVQWPLGTQHDWKNFTQYFKRVYRRNVYAFIVFTVWVPPLEWNHGSNVKHTPNQTTATKIIIINDLSISYSFYCSVFRPPTFTTDRHRTQFDRRKKIIFNIDR